MARRIYYLSGSLPNVGRLRGSVSTPDELRRARIPACTAHTLLSTRAVPRAQAALRRAAAAAVPARPAALGGLACSAFFAVALWWSVRGFEGDHALLIPIFLLTGVGFILMVSLRDPLRDNMIFIGFAQGAIGGCVLLAVLSFVDVEARVRQSQLRAAAGQLRSLGCADRSSATDRASSDAKVNLFGFQPVELIRILLVLFLAGYFAQRWDVLRHARETRPRLAWLSRYVDVPPLEYVAAGAVSASCFSLAFFFLQKDLGPALVFTCLFLALYAVARGSVLMAVAGLALLVARLRGRLHARRAAHRRRARLHVARAVEQRVHGGDQLAQSLWAFATGGPFGTGPAAAIRPSCPRRIPTWCSPRSAKSGASSACCRVRALRASSSTGRCASRCARARRLRVLSRRRPGGRHWHCRCC